MCLKTKRKAATGSTVVSSGRSSTLDDSELSWLALDGVYLHVVVTGGSSTLPMMQQFGKGVIVVKGHRIMRKARGSSTTWMNDQPVELAAIYPQLSVAIGGVSQELPETLTAPPVFGGGTQRKMYDTLKRISEA